MEKNASVTGQEGVDTSQGLTGQASAPLSDEQVQRMQEVLKKYPDARHALFMRNACVHCGWCADSCHYYLSTGDPDLMPAAKSERVRRSVPSRHSSM